MDWAAIILPAVVSGACACWAAYGAGRRRGASEALKTVEGALEPLLADGEPLPRDKGRFRSFAPSEEVTLRADPTPSLIDLSRYEAVAKAAGITAEEVRSVLDGVIEEIATELLDDCWRKRIAKRLTEWQKGQQS